MPKLKAIDEAELAAIINQSEDAFADLSDIIHRYENNAGSAFEPTEQNVLDMVIRAEAFSTLAKHLLRQRRMDASSRELEALRSRS